MQGSGHSRVKANISQIKPHEIKHFWTAKEAVNDMKKQSMEWKKISAIYVSDNVLVSGIHKEFINQSITKTNILIKNSYIIKYFLK